MSFSAIPVHNPYFDDQNKMMWCLKILKVTKYYCLTEIRNDNNAIKWFTDSFYNIHNGMNKKYCYSV